MNWIDLEFFTSRRYEKLTSFLLEEKQKGKSIHPGFPDILKAYELCPLDKVKVVILGQDPYPNASHAMGLAFSVYGDVKPIPSSLKNIYKELVDDIQIKEPQNGDLTPWAKQGVFLLNTTLTIEEGKSNSHKDLGWKRLIDETIFVLSATRKNLVFILWGNNAKKYKMQINTREHLVLESVHPSPLSCSNGFFGSKPFSQTNAYLKKKHIEPINWVI